MQEVIIHAGWRTRQRRSWEVGLWGLAGIDALGYPSLHPLQIRQVVLTLCPAMPSAANPPRRHRRSPSPSAACTASAMPTVVARKAAPVSSSSAHPPFPSLPPSLPTTFVPQISSRGRLNILQRLQSEQI